QIGLGLRLLVQRDRRLESHDPSWGKNGPQRVVDGADCGRVIGALQLRNDQLAADQLDRRTTEHAEVDEPVVLATLPTPHRERRLRHGITVSASTESVNVCLRRRSTTLESAGQTGSDSFARYR